MDFLREIDLRRFAVLHFAAHALMDETNPQRSSIVLAATSSSNHGYLEASEIDRLHLEGQLVVLSSCRSAAGRVLRGEGAMSLARAFFRAGSRTVVASLWPVHDDEAATFFKLFYAQLARGHSVSAALTAAQKSRIAAGAPAAAWAGFVVLGDGDLVPLPGGRKPRFPSWLPALAIGLVAVIGLLIFLRSRASRAPLHPKTHRDPTAATPAARA